MALSEPLAADKFVDQFRDSLIPLTTKIHWFSLTPMSEDDRIVTVEEPLESLPPRLVELLPRIGLFLVPYLREQGRNPDLITFDPPDAKERSDCFQIVGPDHVWMLMAVQDLTPNELHYNLFNALSSVAWEVSPPEVKSGWMKSLKDELRREVHGEIDEISWVRKNELLSRQSQPVRETKLLRDYARASYIDTMTLFLHGICCDIDVEPSPRQIPSLEIRRRLELLRQFYPLGEGFALFPEELTRARFGRSERMVGPGTASNGIGAASNGIGAGSNGTGAATDGTSAPSPRRDAENESSGEPPASN